jgi:hypothetical protein
LTPAEHSALNIDAPCGPNLSPTTLCAAQQSRAAALCGLSIGFKVRPLAEKHLLDFFRQSSDAVR